MKPTDDATSQGTETGAKATPGEGARREPASARTSTGPKGRGGAAPLVADRMQFIIGLAPRQWPFGGETLDLNFIAQTLEADPEVRVLRRIVPRTSDAVLPGPGQAPTGQGIIVAEMPAARGHALQRHFQLVVEVDAPLELAGPLLDTTFPLARPVGAAWSDAVLTPPFFGTPLSVPVVVTDPEDHPVEGAVVCAFGSRLPAVGITDKNGRAELVLLDESPASVRGLSVKPRCNHWDRWIPEPQLDPSQPNPVVVERLDAFFPGFPGRELTGWGLRAMRIDQLPPEVQGRGVKVAVIDSGAAIDAHPDLKRHATGFDLVGNRDSGWAEDTAAHGSHSLGVVASLRNGAGIQGIAPEAEVVVYKVFPGGRCSTLIEALDHCLEDQVDVVNLSLCMARPSVLVEQKLEQLRQRGIACVAAAGNTAGPVAYPASSRSVLAVAAVGRLGEFPPDSHHAAQPAPGVPVSRDGFFAARLSAHGPEIDVCGPGVAIVSTVPPDGYAAWDGTSSAASHVSGLAALVLAHHPDFAGPFGVRTAVRVDRLFNILRRSARPLGLRDPRRTGAGLPDALAAFQGVLAPVPPLTTGWPSFGWTGSPIDQLAAVLREAGMMNGNGNGNGGNGRPRPGARGGVGVAGEPPAPPWMEGPAGALRQLQETLQRAGIWPEPRRFPGR